jgi:hypothetical protein
LRVGTEPRNSGCEGVFRTTVSRAIWRSHLKGKTLRGSKSRYCLKKTINMNWKSMYCFESRAGVGEFW